MSHHKKQAHHIRPYKIVAQTAGLVACIFIIFLILGNGIPEILQNDENEFIPFIPLLVLSVAGYLISWYKEFAGAVFITVGGFALLIFFMVKGDAAMGVLYGLPFIVAGSLFLLHITKRIQLKSKI